MFFSSEENNASLVNKKTKQNKTKLGLSIMKKYLIFLKSRIDIFCKKKLNFTCGHNKGKKMKKVTSRVVRLIIERIRIPNKFTH